MGATGGGLQEDPKYMYNDEVMVGGHSLQTGRLQTDPRFKGPCHARIFVPRLPQSHEEHQIGIDTSSMLYMMATKPHVPADC